MVAADVLKLEWTAGWLVACGLPISVLRVRTHRQMHSMAKGQRDFYGRDSLGEIY